MQRLISRAEIELSIPLQAPAPKRDHSEYLDTDRLSNQETICAFAPIYKAVFTYEPRVRSRLPSSSDQPDS